MNGVCLTANMLDVAQSAVNPLVPAFYDVAFSVVPLILVAVMVVSLVSIIRRYRAMSVFESFGWTALVVFAPIIGAIVWFAIGRDRYEAQPAVD